MVQQKVDEMENQIHVVFQAISDNAESEGASLEEKMRKIAQNLQQYKDQIKELEEHKYLLLLQKSECKESKTRQHLQRTSCRIYIE
jgi:t-SNARE complex subunit (syntaxin)